MDVTPTECWNPLSNQYCRRSYGSSNKSDPFQQWKHIDPRNDVVQLDVAHFEHDQAALFRLNSELDRLKEVAIADIVPTQSVVD
jgi:hypothetical protein